MFSGGWGWGARKSRVQAKVLPNTRQINLHGKVRQRVVPGSEVHTDEYVGYQGLEDDDTHQVINHAEEYARGHVTTNRIENCWTLLNEMDPLCPTVAAAFVTVFATIDLVGGTAVKARLHEDICRRFIALERQMELAEKPIDVQSLAKCKATRLEIEADEPPVYQVLNSLCHHELLLSTGNYDKKYFARIHWYQRWFAQCFDMQDDKIMIYGQWEKANSEPS